MKINIVCIGKPHEKEWISGIDFYLKRIKPFAEINFIILPLPKRNSTSSIESIKEKEGTLILNQLRPGSYNILLDERGQTLNSLQHAKALESLKNFHRGPINIIIGGAYGTSEQVKHQCQALWSLSALTFPHQMVRVILLEQIYRSFTIMNHTGYHHE